MRVVWSIAALVRAIRPVQLCDVLLPEFVWAALDCPSGWSFLSSGNEVALLGEFSAAAGASLHCNEEYIVAGWEFERSGRKRLTGAAIYDTAGAPLAWSRATWITIDPPKLSNGQ